MATASKNPQGKIKRVIKEVFFRITKCLLGIILAFLVLLGGIEVYDVCFPEKVPDVYNIGRSPERDMAQQKSNRWNKFTNKEENWYNLQATLKILKKVCPEAAKWVSEQHEKGLIVWEVHYSDYYARYDYFDKVLTLNESFLVKNDGEKAALLAHEFRHSRQNLTKPLKAAIFTLLTGEHREEVKENDAYHFEKEVMLAIFN